MEMQKPSNCFCIGLTRHSDRCQRGQRIDVIWQLLWPYTDTGYGRNGCHCCEVGEACAAEITRYFLK
jgi:hypothetical protein